MGKAHNKSTPNSTSPIKDSYREFSLETTQDTYNRRTTLDILKEIKEYEEQIKELKGENDKLWKELEGEDKLRNEVETLKRSYTEMKKETDQ